MIAKCLAILAVVAQINASVCGCGSSVVVPTSGCSSSYGPAVLVESGSSSLASSRTVVAKGRYPVALGNCGPSPSQQIPIATSYVTAPVQEKPTVRLPASIPAPRTVSHSCTCYQTILRPRVHQQIITVPTVQRYIETLQKPVVESFQYEAVPVNCGSSSGVVALESGSGCGSQVQTIQLPAISASCAQPVVEVPVAQRVEIPQIISLGGSSCNC